MIESLLLAMLAPALAPAKGGYEPPAQVWYNQAVGCAASAMAVKEKGREPTGDEFAEAVTWGFILADSGRKAGRTKAQVDSADLDSAMPFYRHLKAKKPPAFAAHRAYCKALLDADRP